jgi:hypothetical protein
VGFGAAAAAKNPHRVLEIGVVFYFSGVYLEEGIC